MNEIKMEYRFYTKDRKQPGVDEINIRHDQREEIIGLKALYQAISKGTS